MENENKQEVPIGEKLILQVTLDEGQHIKVRINSKHTPSLSYVHKLLGVEIDKLIINEQMTKMASEHRIVTPPKRGGIINFLRGKHAH